MTKHLIIPDVQAKPGNDFAFLEAIGAYIVDKQPDTVVCLGDFADMSSLSSYDKGTKSFEGRRYKLDIEAANTAMRRLLEPLAADQVRRKQNKQKRYRPRMVLTLGNHEDRISRAVEKQPELEGVISLDDLRYKSYGWEVHPFLDPVVIDGICYCHYFSSGVMDRPVNTANLLVTKKHMSCVAGHQQGRQVATDYRADGKRLTAMIVGSCYEHDEDYMSQQGNNHWRGIVVLHEVNEGEFDEMFVSLNYLKRKYL